MITSENNELRDQIQMLSVGDLVPEDHLLRKIDKAIDWSFIYDLVQDKYSPDFGRPSVDPVTLIKIPLIQYLYGIKSMRQTIKEIEVNVAYRWFLGLDFTSKVPHFSTLARTTPDVSRILTSLNKSFSTSSKSVTSITSLTQPRCSLMPLM